MNSEPQRWLFTNLSHFFTTFCHADGFPLHFLSITIGNFPMFIDAKSLRKAAVCHMLSSTIFRPQFVTCYHSQYSGHNLSHVIPHNLQATVCHMFSFTIFTPQSVTCSPSQYSGHSLSHVILYNLQATVCHMLSSTIFRPQSITCYPPQYSGHSL